MKTFLWNATIDATGTTQFRILKAQFGDGYAQAAADGLNNQSQSWSLTFIENQNTMMDIKTFLDDSHGTQPFLWTPPLSQPITVTAREYAITPKSGDVYSLSVTFVQTCHHD